MIKLEHELPRELPAVRIRQTEGGEIYQFALEGKLLPQLARVAHAGRDGEGNLTGHQRTEQRKHINGIRDYLPTPKAIIPNPIVICFDTRVKFIANKGQPREGWRHEGRLKFPKVTNLDERPGVIIDGQQRTAAIRESRVESFPMPVLAFITDSEEEQRAHFILVNNAKPVQASLQSELAPHTSAVLPANLQRRREPARLLERLNHTPGSALKGRIRTPTCPSGVIRDNSMLRMLDNSLAEGALSCIYGSQTYDETSYSLLNDFWTAVSHVFDYAWMLPPRKSRLMHGAGIVSVGNLMDAIVARHSAPGLPTREDFEDALNNVAADCAWTDGDWDFPDGVLPWNGIQNTNQDVERLREFLQDRLYYSPAKRRKRRKRRDP